eukprot:6209790-Pleurochrysis_carterae.AAC.1
MKNMWWPLACCDGHSLCLIKRRHMPQLMPASHCLRSHVGRTMRGMADAIEGRGDDERASEDAICRVDRAT